MGNPGKHSAGGLRGWLPYLLPVVVVAAMVGSFFLGRKTAPKPDPDAALDGRLDWVEGRPVEYETNIVVDDPETLQDLVDTMYNSPQTGLSLQYKNILVSEDGVNFVCFIGNSPDNTTDMYFSLYSDMGLTNEVYRSQLIRPGTRVEKIAFMEQLPQGVHPLYMVQTQVYTGEEYIQYINTQIAVTVTAYVNG